MSGLGATMRRRVLLSVLPASLFSTRSQAQPKRLELASYFLGPTLAGNPMQPFADKVTEGSAGTLQVSLETVAPTMPFDMIGKASALAHYYATEFAHVEPVLGLSALPMLAATFEEAETLLRIARPFYNAALARHGQILLATEPWRPGALWSTFPIRSVADFKGIRFAHSAYVGQRAGWEKPFIRLGAREVTFLDAELMLSSGYFGNIRFAQEFSCFMEIFFAAQLNFLTANREVFDSLTEAQRQLLVATGRDTELALWDYNRRLVKRDQQALAARGVVVAEQPSADVLAALRKAAQPDVLSWAQTMGADGMAILSDYHRAIGRE